MESARTPSATKAGAECTRSTPPPSRQRSRELFTHATLRAAAQTLHASMHAAARATGRSHHEQGGGGGERLGGWVIISIRSMSVYFVYTQIFQ